jgi:hypothetical protein
MNNRYQYTVNYTISNCRYETLPYDVKHATKYEGELRIHRGSLRSPLG